MSIRWTPILLLPSKKGWFSINEKQSCAALSKIEGYNSFPSKVWNIDFKLESKRLYSLIPSIPPVFVINDEWICKICSSEKKFILPVTDKLAYFGKLSNLKPQILAHQEWHHNHHLHLKQWLLFRPLYLSTTLFSTQTVTSKDKNAFLQR